MSASHRVADQITPMGGGHFTCAHDHASGADASWRFEWSSRVRDRVWVAGLDWSEEAILVRGTLLWDAPERVPSHVRTAALQFMRRCRRRKAAGLPG